jgi:hypothetical protein
MPVSCSKDESRQVTDDKNRVYYMIYKSRSAAVTVSGCPGTPSANSADTGNGIELTVLHCARH